MTKIDTRGEGGVQKSFFRKYRFYSRCFDIKVDERELKFKIDFKILFFVIMRKLKVASKDTCSIITDVSAPDTG